LANAADDERLRTRHLALAAGEPDVDVADALDDATRDAMRQGAPDSAAELAELALRLTPDDRVHDAYRRCTIAGEARFSAGDSVRALELFNQANTLAKAGPDHAGALWRIARVRYHHDDIAASRALLEEARTEAGDDLALRAAIEHDLAYPCFATGDLRATSEHGRSAVELAERAGAVHILADALAEVAVADFLLGRGVRWDLMDRARELEDWDEPRPLLLRPSMAVAHILAWADRTDDARDLIFEIERELLERGDDSALPFLAYHVAELDCWSGEWESGRTRAMEADRVARQTSQRGMQALTCYAAALLSAHLGFVDEARAYAEHGISAATATGHLLGNGLNLSVLGFLELSLGHPDRAHALFDPILAGARAGGFDEPGSAWWLPDEIEALVLLGKHEHATFLTEWLDERATAIDRPTGRAAAARSRALLAAADGRTAEALESCDQALTQHDRVRVAFPRARTLLAKGQIARRARKWGVARESLEAALRIFEQLGAALWSRRAQDELARVGGRRASPHDLTDSERQIAALVATGASNREVAAALFLSPKTVSASLGRVYRKLGVTTRTEMAARMHSEPSTP
jgi:DNA-binding CsgD family transcriptional regulator